MRLGKEGTRTFFRAPRNSWEHDLTVGEPLQLIEPEGIRPEVLDLFAERTLRRHEAVPLRLEGGRLAVAIRDPSDIYAAEDLRVISGFEILAVPATSRAVEEALDALFGDDEDAAGPEDLDEAPDGSFVVAESSPDDAPVVRLFGEILDRAVSGGVSDVHLEPTAGKLSVRFRVDGVLREVMSVPASLRNGLVSRVKVLADLDIAERRVPQDGRFTAESGGRRVDLRVASLPTVLGEGAVLRILDPSSLELDLARLGLSERDLARYRRVYTRPYGTTLVTGPTGSGKSTTLYATLQKLNSPEKKIVTIEDPVEYRIEGLAQLQVNPKAGLTFAGGLRSILRADPDIVMIGEIRDPETARTAVEAALTGHLVLATLHTGDAPSAITRLTDMGVEPYLCASAVDCVVAQRLARRLCEGCKHPAKVSEEDLEKLGFPFALSEERRFFEAVGCEACAGTGYKGRVGVFEVMEVTEEIRTLILGRSSSAGIGRAAGTSMTRLMDDGLLKASEGVTSVEEVLRTVV